MYEYSIGTADSKAKKELCLTGYHAMMDAKIERKKKKSQNMNK